MVVEQRAASGCEAASLIVCPPTLVGHWAHEIAKFVAPTILRPLALQGPPQVRPSYRVSASVAPKPDKKH